MKVLIADGKIEEQVNVVAKGDIIVTPGNGHYFVSQVGNNEHKLISLESGNRQRDLGVFSSGSDLQYVLNVNNLPDRSRLIKQGKYKLELEY